MAFERGNTFSDEVKNRFMQAKAEAEKIGAMPITQKVAYARMDECLHLLGTYYLTVTNWHQHAEYCMSVLRSLDAASAEIVYQKGRKQKGK